jgi:AraC family transcriptional regulator
VIVTSPTGLTSRQEGRDAPQPSFILHELARRHFWEGSGQLSIKSFFAGRALYDVGCGRHAVDETSYLILNHQQPYTITIEADTPIESFCVFFEPGLAEEVWRSLTSGDNDMLDEPFTTDEVRIQFFERTYPHDELLSPALFAFRSLLPRVKDNPILLAERLHELMQKLLQVHRQASQDVAMLPALRAATRDELYRRLFRARDYIMASFDQPLSLTGMARVACLSPNHFLRTFKQVFRQSPHQYLTALRLERAQLLLARTDLTVTDICCAVGFESLSSFSWLFRRRVGLSPEMWRRQKR